MSEIIVTTKDETLVVDSRLIAERLGIAFEVWEYLVTDSLGAFPPYVSVWNLLAIMRHSNLKSDICLDIPTLIDKVFYPYLSESDQMTVAWLKLSVIEGIGADTLSRTNEFAIIHSWFRNNYKSFITGAELVPVVAIGKKRPDFLVNVDGVICPVECKLSFGPSGLKQLQGYMKLWQSPYGYAVAAKFSTPLPANVIKIDRQSSHSSIF